MHRDVVRLRKQLLNSSQLGKRIYLDLGNVLVLRSVFILEFVHEFFQVESFRR